MSTSLSIRENRHAYIQAERSSCAVAWVEKNLAMWWNMMWQQGCSAFCSRVVIWYGVSLTIEHLNYTDCCKKRKILLFDWLSSSLTEQTNLNGLLRTLHVCSWKPKTFILIPLFLIKFPALLCFLFFNSGIQFLFHSLHFFSEQGVYWIYCDVHLVPLRCSSSACLFYLLGNLCHNEKKILSFLSSGPNLHNWQINKIFDIHRVFLYNIDHVTSKPLAKCNMKKLPSRWGMVQHFAEFHICTVDFYHKGRGTWFCNVGPLFRLLHTCSYVFPATYSNTATHTCGQHPNSSVQ